MVPRKIQNDENHDAKINSFQCSEGEAETVGQSDFTIH